MTKTIAKFFSKSAEPLAAFTAWCRTMQPNAVADHLCYKCGSTEEFERIRALFETQG